MQDISISDIKQAYFYLKNYFYYDSVNLFIKQKIAEYETTNFQDEISFFEKLHSEVNDRIQKNNFQISFRILPKKIQEEENENKRVGIFLHNVREEDEYHIEKATFFIDTDIPTQLVDILWIMKVGIKLDKRFNDKLVYANRLLSLNSGAKTPLFKKYSDQYSLWRDNALNKAKELLKTEHNVLIISMDIQNCFDSIVVKWEKLEAYIGKNELTNALRKIHECFFAIIKENKHQANPSLPIGLLSSGILANWHLCDLDEEIQKNANPSFYGRYVDDILLVKPVQSISNKDFSIKSCLSKCFHDKVFEKIDDSLCFKNDKQIKIQNSKLIVHYFDYKHSSAGLKIFEKEIRKNASIFRFLPTEATQLSLEEVAYDLFYYGSKYKFRSFINLKENATKFSSFLSGQIILHKLTTKNKRSKEIAADIKKFFKGKNFIDFCRFWTKVFYFLVITQDSDQIKIFYEDILGIIKNTRWESELLTTKLQKDLEKYAKISLSLALALSPKKCPPSLTNLHKYIYSLRESNLFENSYVQTPLMNFSDNNYEESFLAFDLEKINKLSGNKILLSPRFIHLDEFLLNQTSRNLLRKNNKEEINYQRIIDNYQNLYKQTNLFDTNIYLDENENFPIKNITVKDSGSIENCSSFDSRIRIGIVNIKIDEKKDILKSLSDLGKKPNLSFKRQNTLYQIINMAQKEKVDLLVFPELSIPAAWLPAMLQYSRRKRIGFVFGLEYMINQERTAFNYLVTTLPFIHNNYHTVLPVFRLKNHYAPKEQELLRELQFNVPATSKSYYLFNWNGINFTSFICFELADIIHRSYFKLKIDLLACCLYNKDINYYKHLLSSSTRDLHCYVVQSNTSQYGNSCLIQPTSTETSCIMNIKGGENATIIVEDVDIAKLRRFHALHQNNSSKDFKPLPPC